MKSKMRSTEDAAGGLPVALGSHLYSLKAAKGRMSAPVSAPDLANAKGNLESWGGVGKWG